MADQEEIDRAAAALLKIIQAVSVTLEAHGSQIGQIISAVSDFHKSVDGCFNEAVEAMTSLHNRISVLEEIERQHADVEVLRRIAGDGSEKVN
jgi:hypothetical protein